MKADWQAILDSIATSLRTDSVLVTSSLAFVVTFALAIALYLVIKVLVNRAGLNLSATVSLGNQIEQSGGSPADGAPYTRTGRFGIPGGSIKFTLKEEPMVVRMKAGALRKAQTLLATGKDIDSVCHEINPEYASWDHISSRCFKRRWRRCSNPRVKQRPSFLMAREGYHVGPPRIVYQP
jgi:hypothetical protein